MTRIEGPDGEAYLPASAVQHVDGYADVTPDLLTSWRRTGRINCTTVAELAALFDRFLPTDVIGTRPAKYPGASGPEYVYRWSDIVRAETETRLARRRRGGRPRAGTPTGPTA